MTLSVRPTTRVKGVLVDPPMGVVTIDLTDDRVQMRFPNAHVEAFPASAISFIGRGERSIALNWAGTPIVLRCADPGDADQLLARFEHAEEIVESHDSAIRALRLGYDAQLAG